MVDNKLVILDQTLLPDQEKWLSIESVDQLIQAIQNLSVRGAPLLGLAGIYGLHYAAKEATDYSHFQKLTHKIKKARPTAVNLAKLIDEKLEKALHINQLSELQNVFLQEALLYEEELSKESQKIAYHGSLLICPKNSVLTHCNTGSLATIGLGTALGIIKYTFFQGKDINVFFTETRPWMQGARLTSYELNKAKIPSTMIIDSAVGLFMQLKKIDKVIVGADRIALNGDTANKIGTYMIAVLAKENKIPFYIAAPTSTFDAQCKTGEEITIEYRDNQELIKKTKKDTTIDSINPVFDITPSRYITGFITEKGVLSPPFSCKF